LTQVSDEFDDLYRRHAPAAFRRARRLLGSEADAHEVVHDVFLSLFERPQQFAGQSRMSTFLYSAVTHACLNRIRNQRTRARLAFQHFSSPHTPTSGDPPAENHVLLRSLLLRMPAQLAEVAVYYYMDELTHDEISRLLDCSRRHVGDLLERLSAWARAEELAS
jgi:RNA polymerase sigma factor (sigma-70 family)